MLVRVLYVCFILFTYYTLVIPAGNIKYVREEIPKNKISVHSDNLKAEICTGDCFQVREIINHINKSVSPCEDMHSYICNGKELFNMDRNSKHALPEIQNYVARILNSPINEFESKILKIEKLLYRDCMTFGKDKIKQEHEDLAFQTLYREVIRYVKKNSKWQDLDNKLESLGFGHAFFDIKVIPDPEELTTNIILLQPPTVESINVIIDKISTVLYYKNYYADYEKVEAIQDLYDYLETNFEEPVLTFFESLLQVRTILAEKYTTKPVNVKMTLQDLDSFYAQLSEVAEFAEMDWTKTIVRTFRNVNIRIFRNENVFVKSRPYFIELSKLLNRTPNKVIVSAIWTKTIAENLIYINNNLAKSLDESIYNPLFCLQETKLYGASHQFIYDTITSDSDGITLFKKSEEIIFEVKNILNREIINSYILSTNEQVYLQFKLNSITENFFDYIFHPPLNYYEEFELTPSYFFNIIKYRQMLKNKELKTLRDIVRYPLPFSFNDLNDFRNQFILYTTLNNNAILSATLPKRIHYANYGTKIASFLYTLLNDIKNNDDFLDRRNFNHVHYQFINSSIWCYLPEIVDYSFNDITDTITEIIGLKITYKAMLQHPIPEFYDRPLNNLLVNNRIAGDELFFLTYVKNHCYMNRELINIIVSHFPPFSEAFRCRNTKFKKEECTLNAFEIKNENLIKFYDI